MKRGDTECDLQVDLIHTMVPNDFAAIATNPSPDLDLIFKVKDPLSSSSMVTNAQTRSLSGISSCWSNRSRLYSKTRPITEFKHHVGRSEYPEQSSTNRLHTGCQLSAVKWTAAENRATD